MALSPRMNPKAQNTALHIAVEAVTGDSAIANELVPLEGEEPSQSSETASLAWGTLIDGKPITVSGDVNQIEFVEELMKLLAIEFIQIQQSGTPPPMKRIQGIANVIGTVKLVLQQVATDPSRADWIREQMQVIGAAENMMKAWVQQNQQAAQAQPGGGPDGQVAADVKATEIKANAEATAQAHLTEQELRHKELAFQQSQQHKDAKTAAEIQAQSARTQVEIAGQAARTKLQLEAEAAKPEQ